MVRRWAFVAITVASGALGALSAQSVPHSSTPQRQGQYICWTEYKSLTSSERLCAFSPVLTEPQRLGR